MKPTLAILTTAVTLCLHASAVPAGISIGTIEEDPEVIHEKWKRKAEEDFKTGMEARAAGKKGQAVKFLTRAYDIGRRYRIDSPYPQKAADELVKLSQEGLRELDVARDLVGGEAPRAGMLELKRITRTYLGLPPAKQAGALLRQLEGAPTFQARLRASELAEQLAHAETLETKAAALAAEADLDDVRGDKPPENETPAETKPAEAAADAPAQADSPEESPLPTEPPLPDGVDAADVGERSLSPAEREARRLDLLAEAHTIYTRVAETGKGTEVGKKAEAARRRLEQDADLMARIRRARQRDQAREWLSLGTNYMRAGRMDKAREFFEKIVAECPDTPQAREARGFLGGMTK